MVLDLTATRCSEDNTNSISTRRVSSVLPFLIPVMGASKLRPRGGEPPVAQTGWEIQPTTDHTPAEPANNSLDCNLAAITYSKWSLVTD